MRIVFLGKGGSGKTTLTSLMALCAIEQERTLLTVDGDVNIHLGAALGIPHNTPCLGDNYQELFKALEGNNPAFVRTGVSPECGSLPPSSWSHRVRLQTTDQVLNRYAWKDPVRSWWHVQLGNYGSVDHGGDCYHYKQNALELFIHRLSDSEDELVFTDATAGIDHVATSLSVGYDLCVFGVEPTLKSISVALDFQKLATASDIAFAFVGNKIENVADFAFLEKHLGNGALLGQVEFAPSLGRSEQGDLEALRAMTSSCMPLFNAILNEGKRRVRTGRDAQNAMLRSIYTKECLGYWNAYHGIDLLEYLDGGSTKIGSADTRLARPIQFRADQSIKESNIEG